jgi:hypothetical protein
VATGTSASTLDHFYDKLLHLGDADAFTGAGVSYFESEAERRHKVVVDFVCAFGKNGVVCMPQLPRGCGMDPVAPLPCTLPTH